MTTKKRNACKHEPGQERQTGVSEIQNHSTPSMPTSQESWTSCGNSAEAQRQRLLAAIQERGSISTLEARKPDLDIMHPSARIMELKKRGIPLQTVRVPELSPAGKVHNVARYILTDHQLGGPNDE